MKLVSYIKDAHDQLAVLIDGFLFDMENLHPDLPNTMSMFLQYWEDALPMALGGEMMVRDGTVHRDKGVDINTVELLAPIPFPGSCRDGFAFRQHVEAVLRNGRNVSIDDFSRYPVFSFANHHSVRGGGEILCMPDHFEQLDFELEVAIVVAKPGRNIRAAEADEYIGGLMIMNDITARTLQWEEIGLNLSMAKGKDFATSIGPWLVTLDELKPFEAAPKAGHTGKTWNLRMQCRVNGHLVSEGNVSDMDWTFAEIIERASYGVDLYPGDIIGSGTVGSGCFMELNGTGKLADPNYQVRWLGEGDCVELEVEQLGLLINEFAREESDFSLLAQKKNP